MTAFMPPVVELGRWPRLLVVGDRIEPALADEVCVRTDTWALHTNDHVFRRELASALGIPVDIHGFMDGSALGGIRRRVRALPLHHLHNHRIVSCRIGGPHGWCAWNGSLGCASHYIGRQPTIGEVTEDWSMIAREWPALALTAQAYHDTDERVLVQWRIRGGRVDTVLDPGTDPVTVPHDPVGIAGPVQRERGVAVEHLRSVVRRLEAVC